MPEESGKRVFASPAYVMEIEPGVFGMFRSIEVEETDPRTGKPVREKLRAIGPLALLREARDGERVVLRTMHPKTGMPIMLAELERP